MKLDLVKLDSLVCVGLKRVHSMQTFNPQELWGSFMPLVVPHLKTNRIHLLNAHRYPTDFFEEFSPQLNFEQWALVGAGDLREIPGELMAFEIPGGEYVRYTFSGSADAFGTTLAQVIHVHLPPMGYRYLDGGVQFERFLAGKRPGEPGFEEEVLVPVTRI